MNVSLRQLKGFLLVARLGSFTRAAEQLHITQAGLSAMMRDLERQFDCRLFDRTTRSVTLTGEGMGIVEPVQIAVATLEQARTQVNFAMAAARRVLTIAVTSFVASTLFPLACRRFQSTYPGCEVRIKDVPRADIQGLVDAGEVDAGFGISLKAAAGTNLDPLFRFPLAFVAPAGCALPVVSSHDAEGLRSLAWADLPEAALLALNQETSIQQVVEECLAEAGHHRDYVQVCNSMQTVLALIEAGLGSAILPSMVVPLCPKSKYEVIRLTAPTTYVQFYQITKKGREVSSLVEPFSQILIDCVRRVTAMQPA